MTILQKLYEFNVPEEEHSFSSRVISSSVAQLPTQGQILELEICKELLEKSKD